MSLAPLQLFHVKWISKRNHFLLDYTLKTEGLSSETGEAPKAFSSTLEV